MNLRKANQPLKFPDPAGKQASKQAGRLTFPSRSSINVCTQADKCYGGDQSVVTTLAILLP